MAKAAETNVHIMELGDGKVLLVGVLSEEQLEATYGLFEPKSRTWRGQFQSLAKAVVEAYNKRAGKAS